MSIDTTQGEDSFLKSDPIKVHFSTTHFSPNVIQCGSNYQILLKIVNRIVYSRKNSKKLLWVIEVVFLYNDSTVPEDYIFSSIRNYAELDNALE